MPEPLNGRLHPLQPSTVATTNEPSALAVTPTDTPKPRSREPRTINLTVGDPTPVDQQKGGHSRTPGYHQVISGIAADFLASVANPWTGASASSHPTFQ